MFAIPVAISAFKPPLSFHALEKMLRKQLEKEFECDLTGLKKAIRAEVRITS